MKKRNTWLTIALGVLVTVTVAAVTIVWSGTRTNDDPDSGLESTNGQQVGNQTTEDESDEQNNLIQRPEETEAPETDNVLSEPPETDNVLHETWDVPEYDDSVLQVPETDPPMDDVQAQPETEEAAPAVGEQVYSLNFGAGETVSWPVEGNVIQHYSMDTTVYFPTLKQYQCSPAIEIQSEAGTKVVSPANAKVIEVGEDAKIGRYLRMEIGNDYQIVLGQLDQILVNEGDYIARGTEVATLAAPTRYYVVEGDNLYFQMYHGEETVDPLDYLE